MAGQIVLTSWQKTWLGYALHSVYFYKVALCVI